jgi:hypothetical protein
MAHQDEPTNTDERPVSPPYERPTVKDLDVKLGPVETPPGTVFVSR